MYYENTDGVKITVTPNYVPEHSYPDISRYLHIYNVKIENTSDSPIQILERHWVIVDGSGNREEVNGEGIIGEQPSLSPGESFEYSSGCPLTTPTGNMRGSYTIKLANGKTKKVKIPLFFLRDYDNSETLN